jgi:hypothetical protein
MGRCTLGQRMRRSGCGLQTTGDCCGLCWVKMYYSCPLRLTVAARSSRDLKTTPCEYGVVRLGLAATFCRLASAVWHRLSLDRTTSSTPSIRKKWQSKCGRRLTRAQFQPTYSCTLHSYPFECTAQIPTPTHTKLYSHPRSSMVSVFDVSNESVSESLVVIGHARCSVGKKLHVMSRRSIERR